MGKSERNLKKYHIILHENEKKKLPFSEKNRKKLTA